MNASANSCDVNAHLSDLFVLHNAGDPPARLHRVQRAPALNLQDGPPLSPSDACSVWAQVRGVNAENDRTIRIDFLTSRAQNQIGRDEAVERAGYESLTRR